MSTERDLPRILQAWLHEDAHEFGDHVLDRVLDQLDATPQGPASGLARRFQFMNSSLVRYGLPAAAVVVIAIFGFWLIGGSNVGGPEPSPSLPPSQAVDPTPLAPASAEPSIPPEGSLPEGPFTLWDAPGDVGITVTIPGPGWFGEEGGGMLVKNQDANPPPGEGLMVFQGPLYVYGDACHWSTTTPDRPTRTMAGMLAALEAQTQRDGGNAGQGGQGWNIGGTFGWGVDLNVPTDAVLSDCDGGQLRYWVGDPQLDANVRSHDGPGQVDQLWIGNVMGELIVFDIYFAGIPRNVVDELWIAVDHGATTFEMP